MPTTHLQRIDHLTNEQLEWFGDYQKKVFDRVAAESPVYQGLTPSEIDGFNQVDDAYFLLLVEDETNEILAHSVLCWDIDVADWFSRPFFERHYPEALAERRICVFGSLGVADGPHRLRRFNAVLDRSILDLGDRNGIAIADVRAGGSAALLPRYIAARSEYLCESFSWSRLLTQEFYAFELSGRSDGTRDFRRLLKALTPYSTSTIHS